MSISEIACGLTVSLISALIIALAKLPPYHRIIDWVKKEVTWT